MLRAVDMQQVLLQSHSSEKVQQIQQQHPDNQQRYFAMQLQEEKKLLKEKVKNSEEAERAKLRERQEKESGRNARNGASDGRTRADRPEDSDDDAEEGHHINIRV